jgi:transcriptional regulator with XRE-family HTH domain
VTDAYGLEPIGVDRAAALYRLHERSDLTWGQIAKLMGVSRGGVQQWASGGWMNPGQSARLTRIADVVDSLDGSTPAERLEALMAPMRPGGQSRFDDLRSENASSPDDINAP